MDKPVSHYLPNLSRSWARHATPETLLILALLIWMSFPSSSASVADVPPAQPRQELVEPVEAKPRSLVFPF